MLFPNDDKRLDHECGMMAVETVVSMVVFLAVIGFLVNLINIYTFHNRMQHALNAAAHDISSISYLGYIITGARDLDREIVDDGKKYTAPTDDAANKLIDTYNKINNISESLSNLGDFTNSVKDSAEAVRGLAENADDTAIAAIYHALIGAGNMVKGSLAASLAEDLVKGYVAVLDTGFSEARSYEEVLDSYGVTDVEFTGTELFPAATMNGFSKTSSIIKIQVQYKIHVGIFNIKTFSSRQEGNGFLSGILDDDGNTIRVVQCAVVSGWLDGDGKYLKDYR